MKILITTDAFSPMVNGVVTSTLNLYEELTKLGHEVRILTLNQERHSVRIGNIYYIRSFGVHFYPNARGTLAYRTRYLKEILEWHPDLIHTQTEFCTFFLAQIIAKKLNIPIVHTYHTMYEDYTNYFIKSESIGHKAVEIFSRNISKHVNVVIAPTSKVKNVLKHYQVSVPIEVIPTGLDLTQFQRQIDTEEKRWLKEKLGIGADEQVVVTVGRLGVEKNVDELIHHFKQFLKLKQKVKFLIVGDGPHRVNLENKVKEAYLQNDIIFTGMISPKQVYAYYKISDVFISASTSETQGLTYIEALSSGLPILCKRDECLSAVLEEEVNGYFYETAEEFKDRLIYMLNHEEIRQRLGDHAASQAKQYSKEQFAECVERLYKQILGQEFMNHYEECQSITL